MLRIIPLGGLGEIGLNSMLFENEDTRILVDAGVLFATDEMPGVDWVLPDFSYLQTTSRLLDGIVLTHGHEDHVGALPYLLRDFPAPVYATRFTLGLVRHRLEEMGVAADLREIRPRSTLRIGSFDIEPIRVCHSVPDSIGLVVHSKDGVFVHTGDFKLDATPDHGPTTDIERFREVGHEGVTCLFSDSTNAEVPGDSVSEKEVARTLEKWIRSAEGRVILSCIGSHIYRMRTAFELALRTERKVCVLGRSMARKLELAQELGEFPRAQEWMVSQEEAAHTPDAKLLILASGSQAEPRSALRQLAYDESDLSVRPGDLVLLSARTLPGSERTTGALLDRLIRKGATVRYPRIEPTLHTSGHAAQNEQRRMIETVQPQHFVPIHGELRHLHRHLETAAQSGVSQEGLLLAENGRVLAFENGRGRLAERVNAGRRFLDRFGAGEVTQELMRDRLRMGEIGVVVGVVTVRAADGALVDGPTFIGKGLTATEHSALRQAEGLARTALLELSTELRSNRDRAEEALVRAARQAFKAISAKRPTVLPHLIRL